MISVIKNNNNNNKKEKTWTKNVIDSSLKIIELKAIMIDHEVIFEFSR